MKRLLGSLLIAVMLASTFAPFVEASSHKAPATNVEYVGGGLWHFTADVTFTGNGLLQVDCDRTNQLDIGTDVPDVTAPVPYAGMTCVAAFRDETGRLSAWSAPFLP